MSGFDAGRLSRLRDVMSSHVERDTVGGVAWLAARGDDVEVGVAGTLTRGRREPVRRDSIFRIASMTKPMLAVGALVLVEECPSTPAVRSTARPCRPTAPSPSMTC